jgi:hypothetical protein
MVRTESSANIAFHALSDILVEFGVPMKLVRLIKMCLNETYSKVHISKCISDSFPIHIGLEQGDALSPLLFNFAIKRSGRTRFG